MPTPTPSTAFPGYLPPAPAPRPAYDAALEDIFHDVIAGITGVGNTLVRPRWQPEPPDQPDFSTDWIAFGVMSTKKDWNPYQRQDGDGLGGYGETTVERTETLTLLLSFYGPHAYAVQNSWETGIQVAQNRAALDALNIKFVEALDAYNVPALMKQRWVPKVDQRCVFRRGSDLVYPVLNLTGVATSQLDNELYKTDINVPTPPP